MVIGVVIAIMIAIVVGVNLIPIITGVVENATEGASTTVSSLIGILPYIFVAVILLGAVAWIGGIGTTDRGTDRREKIKEFTIRLVRNPKSLIVSIKRASSSWTQYTNNLDELLGIKTVVASENNAVEALLLNSDRQLFINEKDYDWYITDKNPNQDMFKVVGLHKEDSAQNKVYLLGRNITTNTPYLVEAPIGYLEATCLDCASYIVRSTGKRDLIGSLV